MTTGRRILVIDDDPLFRSLIVSILRTEFHVAVASEGSDGYYKALEHPPDVAIVDIQMPGWDGLKTLKAFRCHPVLSKVKILILTSDASKETVLAAIHGGANDYVVKTSFSKDELYKKLTKLLGGNGEAPATANSSVAAKDTASATHHSTPAGHNDRSTSNGSAPATHTTESDTPADDAHLQEMIDGWE